MNSATARAYQALAVALSFFLLPFANTMCAQSVSGVVRGREHGQLFGMAHVTASDVEGKELGSTTTDELGRFKLRLKSIAKPVVITILRMGIIPTKTDPLLFGMRDTSDYEFLVDENAVRTDTMRVQERIGVNERNLNDAKRRGWKVYLPVEVQRHRENARSLRELMQSLAGNGVIVPSSDNECFRSTLTNRCLTLVIDGRPVGTTYGISPNEIYFMAVVSRTDAATQWSSLRVPDGALVIYTRMYGDRYK